MLTTALTAAALVCVTFQFVLTAKAGFPMGDFHAFYCAATAVAHGANPYHTQPLHACEASTGLRAFFAKYPGVTVPAPLPGYALGLLLPLTWAPPGLAAAAWLAILLAACALASVTLARTANVPLGVTVAAFAFSVGVASIPFGEVVPIAIAAICASGYFASRARWAAASIAAAVAMVEPHLGLPLCLSLAIWAPRTRATLAAAGVALTALSLALLGWGTNLEYFLQVLPAHALSEAGRDTQFSLTSVLTSFGAGPAIATKIGLLSYLAMIVAGVATAGWLARRTRSAAFIAFVPPAFAVFGGTFIHVTQIAAAIPAAVMLAHCLGERRHFAVIPLLLLSIPWILSWSPIFGIAPAFPIVCLVWYYWPGNLKALTAGAVLGGLLVVGANRALIMMSGHPLPARAAPTIASNLPEESWSTFATKSSNGTAGAWLVRLPTWGGVALLVVLTIAQARGRRLQVAVEGSPS